MKSRKPLVARFQTAKGNQYLYDAVSNCVFPCPDIFIEVLERYADCCSSEQIVMDLSEKYARGAIGITYSRIHDYVEHDHCFFRAGDNGKDEHYLPRFDISEEEYWEKLLYKVGCGQLILVVTENCNMRCRYCAYCSGFYPYQRAQTDRMMSFETAKVAIDYFRELRSHTYVPLPRRPFITFYGGEPLLRFDLIQRCIEYAKSIETGDVKFGFNLTTNATLLTLEMIEYFVAKEVYLTVSLDGPQKIHDANRVFPSGQGTFEKVMSALQTVRDIDPDYYKTYVLITTTYDWRTDMEELNRFFVENKDGLPYMGLVNLVSDVETTYYDRFSPEERADFLRRMQQLVQIYYEAKTGKGIHALCFLDRLFLSYSLLANRDHIHNPFQDGWYTNACLPGMKLAVYPDGSLHLCERVNPHFSIGDCRTGLDFGKIRSLMRQYSEQVFDKCNECIAQRSCRACWATVCGEGVFDKEKVCQEAPGIMLQTLALVYSILEENPQAFDDLPRVFEENPFLWD